MREIFPRSLVAICDDNKGTHEIGFMLYVVLLYVICFGLAWQHPPNTSFSGPFFSMSALPDIHTNRTVCHRMPHVFSHAISIKFRARFSKARIYGFSGICNRMARAGPRLIINYCIAAWHVFFKMLVFHSNND